MSTLSSTLKKITKAKGPSRELDLLVHNTIRELPLAKSIWEDTPWSGTHQITHFGYSDGAPLLEARTKDSVPHYTCNTEDCVSLFEHLFPVGNLSYTYKIGPKKFQCEASDYWAFTKVKSFPTAPLAIIGAILSLLQEMEKQWEGRPKLDRPLFTKMWSKVQVTKVDPAQGFIEGIIGYTGEPKHQEKQRWGLSGKIPGSLCSMRELVDDTWVDPDRAFWRRNGDE